MKVGPYEVLDELGRGGMGVVHRVRAPGGRVLALKLLFKANAETFARFERESRLLASLGESEGFVSVIEVGSSSEGLWIVMPFVPGGTLRERLDRGPLRVDETIELGLELARALGRAHEKGIVHRDVKPENVLFTASGRPLVSDLGLAKHFDPLVLGASQSIALTESGAYMGTAGYSPREQLEDASKAGPPADVFALGALLYECLAGQPAFPGESAMEIHARASAGDYRPIGRAGVPPWFSAVIAKTLRVEPEKRFADGGELARAIARGRAGKDERGVRMPLLVGVGAGALLLAGVLAVAGGYGSTGERPLTAAPRPVVAPPPVASPPVASPPVSPAREIAASAEKKLDAKDWDGAIADATRAIELDPELALAWYVRCDARGCKNEWVEAEADGARAVALDPRTARYRSQWAVVAVSRRDWDTAIERATRAIELDPRCAEAWKVRGGARGQKGDQPGDIADSTRALELDPGDVDAVVNRGIARGLLGDRDGEIADLTRGIELDPSDPMAWRRRGLARRAKGDSLGAISDLEKALALAPDDPEAPGTRRALEEARGGR
jgi:hypothetical protein